MRKIRQLGGATALVAAAALLAGCGGDEAAADGPLADAVVSPGKLIFSTSGNYAPFTFADKTGEVSGYDVEVCSKIAERLDLEPEPKVVTFNQTIAGVEAGQYDMACTGVALTPERASSKSFYVTDATGTGGTGMIVLEDSSFETVEDLRGKRHGEASGASQGQDVEDALDGDIETTQYPGAAEQILALKSGRIDVLSVNALVAAYYANQDDKLRALPPINPGDQVQIVSRDSEELLDAVNEQIAEMWEDGTLAELQQKYFGEELERPSE